MNNPTDTNQASEDRLIIAIEALVDVSLDLGKQAKMMTLADVHTPQAIPDNEKLNMALQPYKDKVLHIIRTEKLKLLAEVMEEAFSGGLSFELDDGRIVIEVETDLQSITTKLEAEL